VPVVFDEVVGTVEPESQPAAGPAPAGGGEEGGCGDALEKRRALRRMARRDARLHAD
jgi:hypothetical protein